MRFYFVCVGIFVGMAFFIGCDRNTVNDEGGHLVAGCISGDCVNGKGEKLYFSNGKAYASYNGDWRDGREEGTGVYCEISHLNGQKILPCAYDGEWKNGLPDGRGVKTIHIEADSSRYGQIVGRFVAGSPIDGTITPPEGRQYRAVWHSPFVACYTGSCKDGYGRFLWIFDSWNPAYPAAQCFDSYEGELLNGRPEGYGRHYRGQNDVVYEGIWKNGLPCTFACGNKREASGYPDKPEKGN